MYTVTKLWHPNLTHHVIKNKRLLCARNMYNPPVKKTALFLDTIWQGHKTIIYDYNTIFWHINVELSVQQPLRRMGRNNSLTQLHMK